MFLNRIYCLQELLDHENTIHRKHRLSNAIATHECGHVYRTKAGGRKEMVVLNSVLERLPQKTCSVCFKLRANQHLDKNVIKTVQDNEGTTTPTVDFLKSKHVFYNWLYKHLY